MIDLAALTPRLVRNEQGIWTPSQRTESTSPSVSFPDTGYGQCFEVEDTSFWFAHRNECIAAVLRRFPFKGPFLDIGGGNGVVSARLAADGIDPIVVIEPGLEGAVNARRRGLSNVVCSTIEEAAFAPESFGAAGLFDVIEHVEDVGALLRATHRVLSPASVLCVTVPAYEWLWSADDETAGHYRRYTETRLRRELERDRLFDVAYASYLFAPLTLPLFVLRSLRYRLSRRDKALTNENWAADHHPRRGVREAMNLILNPEVRAVERGLRIPFGTTCLAVALKVS